MGLVARAEHAHKVEEADQRDVARHNDGYALWGRCGGVVAKSRLQSLAIEHLCAYGLYGIEDIVLGKPRVSLHGRAYYGTTLIAMSKLAQSLA